MLEWTQNNNNNEKIPTREMSAEGWEIDVCIVIIIWLYCVPILLQQFGIWEWVF